MNTEKEISAEKGKGSEKGMSAEKRIDSGKGMSVEKAKRIIRIIVNILLVVGVAIVFVNIVTSHHNGLLATSGFGTLRYFTTLSNVFEGLASLALVISALIRKGRPLPKVIETLKYVACVEVFVTFLTVVAFLAPVYGFVETCSGNNFWFHLVFPLTAILEQIILSETRMGVRENLYAVIPPFLYGCGYSINIAINGKGEWPETNDWYGFLNWGLPIGILIFLGICGMSFLLGLLMKGLWRAAHRSEK